jgi:hypothetical protein
MENQETLKAKIKNPKAYEGVDKRELLRESVCAIVFGTLALLLGTREMVFETVPLAFALLASSIRQTPFVFIGLAASAFDGGTLSAPKVIGACLLVSIRCISRLYLDKERKNRSQNCENGTKIPPIAELFSENIYLRIMSSALAVFFVGLWKIIAGGFRFYDLFGSIFYLLLTPLATYIFSKYFDVNEQKLRQGATFSITPSSENL